MFLLIKLNPVWFRNAILHLIEAEIDIDWNNPKHWKKSNIWIWEHQWCELSIQKNQIRLCADYKITINKVIFAWKISDPKTKRHVDNFDNEESALPQKNCKNDIRNICGMRFKDEQITKLRQCIGMVAFYNNFVAVIALVCHYH